MRSKKDLQNQSLPEFKGLTLEQVNKKKSLGLSNQIIDSYTPTSIQIIFRNTFNLINIILIPLLVMLTIYEQYKDVLAFSTFAIINTILSAFDELRIKRQLDKLKSQFQQKVIVIREGKEEIIPVNEVVEGDFIKAKDGDGIVADGKVLFSNYLQLDESALNGESNYIQKDIGEEIQSGSFIVTGECIYEVKKVGKDNFLNNLGAEASKFKLKRSSLQRNGNRLVAFLVVAAITLGLLNFYFTGLNNINNTDRLLSLTTIIVLIIPQTLIFLFTLSFSISITKLYNKGVLVQRGSSIEELAQLDTICLDKTGTITTNEMDLLKLKYFNLKEEEIGSFYNSISEKIVSVNKTQEILNKHYQKQKHIDISEFSQVPFTSKNKYSLLTGKYKDKHTTLVFGAYSFLKDKIDQKSREELESYVKKEEDLGMRVLIGLYFDDYKTDIISLDQPLEEVIKITSNKIAVYTIEEKLNIGIKDVLADIIKQGINVKIISGDSQLSVERILNKIGFSSPKILDLSVYKSDNPEINYKQICEEYSVFTRSKPEDKLQLIKALKSNGHKVAMIGDGINDVLSLKAADVSIAMESGAKIARDVADMVLLKNDYTKIPVIFYEGNNIIFNLKISVKLFLLKSFLSILIAAYFTTIENNIPLLPASTLIFSFIGSSAPSYILVFSRQIVRNTTTFFKDVFLATIPSSIIFALILIIFYKVIVTDQHFYLSVNTSITMLIASLSIMYSIYFMWKAKKLENLFFAITLYAILFIAAILQTILPLTQVDSRKESAILLIIMLFGSFIIFHTLRYIFKPQNKLTNIFLIFVSLLYIPIATFFPFTTYYSVESISPIAYIYIIFLTLVSLILTILIDYVIKVLDKNTKNMFIKLSSK